MRYYSPSTQGFYETGLHGSKIPDDKIEITDEEYNAVTQGLGNIAVGPSGKPENKPSHWHSLNSEKDGWEITPTNQALKDDAEGEVTRRADIKTARDNSGLKNSTAQKAYDFIDNKLDSASTAAEVKEALRDILKKMIPHILD